MTRDTGQAVLLRLRGGQTQTSARLSQAPQGRGGWGADPPAETWRRHGHGGAQRAMGGTDPPNPPPSQDSSGSRSIYSTPTLPDRGEELPT